MDGIFLKINSRKEHLTQALYTGEVLEGFSGKDGRTLIVAVKIRDSQASASCLGKKLLQYSEGSRGGEQP